jgi:hypothetical protein
VISIKGHLSHQESGAVPKQTATKGMSRFGRR